METILDKRGHPDLNLYLLCKRNNCLPYHGGLANQPANLIEKWVLIDNCLNELKKLDSGSVMNE